MSIIEREASTGDTLFLLGDGLIEKWTFSKYRHVGIVCEKDGEMMVFETDLWLGKAAFHPLSKYKNKRVVLYETFGLDPDKVKALCRKYEKAPYSLLDITTNFLTGFLHPAIRRPIVGAVGNKKYMICSELSQRILYEATGLECLKDWESAEPVDLATTMQLNHKHFGIKYIQG